MQKKIIDAVGYENFAYKIMKCAEKSPSITNDIEFFLLISCVTQPKDKHEKLRTGSSLKVNSVHRKMNAIQYTRCS